MRIGCHFLRGNLGLFLALAVTWAGQCLAVAQEAPQEPQEAQEATSQPSSPSPSVQYPLALAAAGDGTIYIGDLNLHGVWQLKDGELTPYFVGSKKFRTPLYAVRCLAIDAEGRLYAGDSSTRQVYRFDENAQPQPITEMSKDNLGPFGVPMGLAFNSQGELFVSDREFRCIWRVPADGGEPQKFVDVPAPAGICFDKDDHLWVVTIVDDPLRRFSPDGKEEVVVKGRPFEYPHNVALDDSGAAYVVDGFQRTLWKVVSGAEPEKWLTHESFVNPVDIKSAQGQLLVVDPRSKSLLRVNLDATAEVVNLK